MFEGRREDRIEGKDMSDQAIMAGVLKNSQETQKKHEQEANTDALTGLPNRRAFDKRLIAALGRLNHKSEHHRESDPDYVLLFIADVNNFKMLNDTYGHTKGDEALQIIAKRFQEEADERGGVPARYAGDEFALTQEAHGELDAGQIEKICARVQEKINAGLSMLAGGTVVPLRISLGCSYVAKSTFEKQLSNGVKIEKLAEMLIHEADAGMYADKQAHKVQER